jgi:hypothetical protein
MQAVGIPHDDPLYLKITTAYDAIFNLSIELHYRACGMEPRKTV